MAKAGVVFTKDNEYYTPSVFVARFGKFDYDPATTKEKAAEFGIENYDTIETDGLKADWTRFKRIWINPPFTNKHEFLKKAVDTFAKTKADIYILFPIEFITTKRFHDILSGWGGGYLCAKRTYQVREWAWQEGEFSGLRELCYETRRYFNDYRRKGGTMITAITFHAIERLQERRNCEHLLRHLNKVRKWDLPDDGITEHSGYRYVTRSKVLVTVLPPSHSMRKANRTDELTHYLIKYRYALFAALLGKEEK